MVKHKQTPFGSRLKESRCAAGLTQRATADAAGISQGMIGHLETGRLDGSFYIFDLADALGVDARWLAKGDGEASPTRQQNIGLSSQVTDFCDKAQVDAWNLYNLIHVLWASLDEDEYEGHPTKCVLRHIMKLAEQLPHAIELIQCEVRRG